MREIASGIFLKTFSVKVVSDSYRLMQGFGEDNILGLNNNMRLPMIQGTLVY